MKILFLVFIIVLLFIIALILYYSEDIIHWLIYNLGMVPIEGTTTKSTVDNRSLLNMNVKHLEGDDYKILLLIDKKISIDKAKDVPLSIFFHGNGMNIYDDFMAWGWISDRYKINCGFIETPGRNGVKRKFTKRNLMIILEKSIDVLKEMNFNITNVTGFSLGTAVASIAACEYNIPVLTLLAPFCNFKDIAYTYVPNISCIKNKVSRVCTKDFNFNTLKLLENYKGKVNLFHGEKDSIILPENSIKIHKKIKQRRVGESKQCVIFKNTDHGMILDPRNVEVISNLVYFNRSI
ncbi:hypothetical protein A0H76_2113 [Hepatospora eriocheir]|uniref:AB hydrolase-1 domain-containing protein n=1 Tax=Hepatospora eriocheir TaxID=1081669 RepID=A0A1X0QK77_9MICR|nr:hypothetical protein A0H76_2113 [Hepatospora eriocheir]